jgi:N-acetylmuramoyl-L-alanine amidase
MTVTYQHTSVIVFCLLAVLLFFVPCAQSKKTESAVELFENAKRANKALLSSPKKKRYRHNWISCAAKFDGVYNASPKGTLAAEALYRSAELYDGLYRYSRKPEDIDAALLRYQKLVAEYGDHARADDAQYRIGEIFFQVRKDISQAYVEFLKVDVNYPEGDMRDRARKMLDQLAVRLSRKTAGDATQHKSSEKSLARLKDIRYWSTPNYTRLVIDVTSPVTYEHRLLKIDSDSSQYRRLSLNLHGARVGKWIGTVRKIKNDLLKRANAEQLDDGSVRVFLDVKKLVAYNVFHLYDPFRIVVDVRGFQKRKSRAVKEHAIAPKKQKTTQDQKKTNHPNKSVSMARQLGLHVKRIVIDPGHGGKDPGCRVLGKYKEKNITLALAKRLAKQLKTEIGCEVFLTREKDEFLTLEQRTAIANMKKADLFISLHVNAHADQEIHGLETYFLNAATDQAGVVIAARENATSEKSVSDLQTILNDLLMNTKMRESSRLAYRVQEAMIDGTGKRYRGIRSLGVKQAPFYVLIGAQMPAVLVEVGFLSNRTERKRLVNPEYQEILAAGITDGIKMYIEGIDQTYPAG